MGRGDWALQVVAWHEGYTKGWKLGFWNGVATTIAIVMVIVGSAMVLRG